MSIGLFNLVFIVLLIIFIIITSIYHEVKINDYDVKTKHYWTFGIMVVFDILFGIFIIFMWYAMTINLPKVYTYEQMEEENLSSYCEVVSTETLTLRTLGDSSSFSSRFFLGSGYINGDQVYSYYYDHREGYQRDSIRASGVLVIEDDSETPRIEWRNYECNTEWFILKRSSRRNLGYGTNMFSDTIIYIPEGTLLEGYNLDNED